jgi:ketosteroid isomerase-like protein
MKFFDDQQRNAIPVIWVTNFSFTKNTHELKTLMENLIETRDKTPNEITEEYFFVLAKNLVLEINKGTFSVNRKDGQDRGPFQMSNSTLWQKMNGNWRIIHSHQSFGSQ